MRGAYIHYIGISEKSHAEFLFFRYSCTLTLIVSSAFGWIQFLTDLSLVLLLGGAFSPGACMGISQTASLDRFDM